MALGDPFDFSTTDPSAPGLLGQSPGFWRDLASFGGNLAAAANARTADGHLANGTSFAGALGPAINDTMQQGRQNALARSVLGYQQAQTQGQQMQNAGTALQLPLLAAQTQAKLGFWQNPQASLDSMYGGGGAYSGGNTSPINQAIVGTEGSGPNQVSDKGAAGTYQVTQPFFQTYAKPGENFANEADRVAVGQRGIAALNQQYGGDPARVAVAYFSGPGNVAPPGSPTPWIEDRSDGHTTVSQYVQRVQAQLGGGQPQSAPPQAEALATQYEQQAAGLMAAANRAAYAQQMGYPSGVDPAALRQQALTFTQEAVKLRAAGPSKAAEAAVTPQSIRPGGVLMTGSGRVVGSAPVQSDEVVTSGPMAGAHTTILRSPVDNSVVGGNGAEVNGVPAGAIIKSLPPGQEGHLANVPKETLDQIEHDRKTVNDDLSGVLESVGPAKQNMLQLRQAIDGAKTGALGELSANMRNYVQTFFPDTAKTFGVDATPAQILSKLALVNSGKMERADLGARGSAAALQMYAKANPNLGLQPEANHDIANAMLVASQYHEDYAQGAVNHYNTQWNAAQDAGSTKGYKQISNYDQEFIQKFRPELYVSAINAMNGKPSDVWAKGLTPAQVQIVGGIVQRVDPNATVDLGGQQYPVAKFGKTLGPTQIQVGGKSAP